MPATATPVDAAVRVLIASRDHMSSERTQAVNALTALLRVSDHRIDARRPLSGRQLTTVAAWRTRDEALATATAREETVRLAKRVSALDTELKANATRLTELITRLTELIKQSPARELLSEPDIGPVTAG